MTAFQSGECLGCAFLPVALFSVSPFVRWTGLGGSEGEAVGPSSLALAVLLGRSLAVCCHRTARGNWCVKVGLEAAATSLDAAILFIGGIVGEGVNCVLPPRRALLLLDDNRGRRVVSDWDGTCRSTSGRRQLLKPRNLDCSQLNYGYAHTIKQTWCPRSFPPR